MGNVEFIYPRGAFEEGLPVNSTNGSFHLEIEALRSVGFTVSSSPSKNAKHLILRGPSLWSETDYPCDNRFVNTWKECEATYRMSIYLPLIEDLSIPTFFCDDLNESTQKEVENRGWDKAFIKKDITSLFCFDDFTSVWPDTSFKKMKDLYALTYPKCTGPYCVREYVSRERVLDENRYWVINHHPYSYNGIVPDCVTKAVERLRILGSLYYTIDATDEFIIEVNPGESSDRGGDNSPEMLASWFAKELLK